MSDTQAAPPPAPAEDPVERLFDGVREFRDNVFPERREQFEQLAKAQNPRILFITCADSRVVPEMITQTEPGELFVCRNIGNIVPAYGEMMGGVSAVVEYAVVALGVTDIVVCGHSNCGAMAGLIRGDEALNKMPTVRSWLRNAHAARSVVEVLHPELDGDDKIQALVEQNVVTQLQHLSTHPTVAAGIAGGKLELHGWVYDIETGAIHLHDAAQGRMVPFEESQGLKRKLSPLMVVVDRFRVTDTLREVWRPLAALFLLDTLVTIAYVGLGWTWIVPAGLPLPLLGTGLAVFLGVRNNTAYARWWEARTLWGAALNNSRSYARALTVLMAAAEAAPLRHALVCHQIAWAHALRCFMRREDPAQDIAPFLPPDTLARVTEAANPPFAIQRAMADILVGARRDGWLDGVEAAALNTTLTALTDCQGGLERIRNTPMPQQYAAFSRVFVTAYCLMLPFGIVPDLNVLTPLGSAVIGFVFLALDRSGRHLEDPFMRSVYDVPMSAITRTVEIDLRQALGDAEVPPPLHPVRGVLR